MINIINNLYIGNSQSVNVANLEHFKIDAVLNVAFDLNDMYDSRFQWYKVGLIDGTGNKEVQIELAYKLLTNLLANDQSVLVHCHEGLSRSVYVVYLFLTKNGMDKEKAIGILNDRIPNNKLNKLMEVYDGMG